MSNNLLTETSNNLQSNGFHSVIFNDESFAIKHVIESIPEGSTVGLGGSSTVKEIGLLDALRKSKITLFDQYEEGISKEENFERRRQGLLSDFFVAGTNAITRSGILINMDGYGNRVASMLFGPKKVFLIVGKNKICDTIEDGFKRIFTVAAPKNAIRFGVKPLCITEGKCDIKRCAPPERICGMASIFYKSPIPDRISILFIDKELGF